MTLEMQAKPLTLRASLESELHSVPKGLKGLFSLLHAALPASQLPRVITDLFPAQPYQTLNALNMPHYPTSGPLHRLLPLPGMSSSSTLRSQLSQPFFKEVFSPPWNAKFSLLLAPRATTIPSATAPNTLL